MSNQIKHQRILSVYERQQLLKYGLTEEEFLKMGELPVEYFTGFVDFAGLTLKVNQKVLIPRIETEEMVDQAFDYLKHSQKDQLRILEIATGSGAITLALINKIHQLNYLNKNWEFYLSELSAAALAVAKNNFQELLAKTINKEKIQVKFILSNLLDEIENEGKFDLVLANLPYIPSQEIEKLSASVKDFEPIFALDGGATGFELIAKSLEQFLENKLLADDSLMILETHHLHDQQFIRQNYPFLFKQFEIKFIKDQFNRQRFIQLKKIKV